MGQPEVVYVLTALIDGEQVYHHECPSIDVLETEIYRAEMTVNRELGDEDDI